MIKLIELSSVILLTTSCENNQNIFDCDTVYFLLLNERDENLLDPKTATKIDINNIQFYYINDQGERVLQDHVNEQGKHVTIETPKNAISFRLTVRINITNLTPEYSKTIIDLCPNGEIEICAKVKMFPLTTPLGAGGSISSANLHIDRKK